jgi:hypothetical protein
MMIWAMPAAAEPVTFATRLHAKLLHPRCLSCHQFNRIQHQGRAFNSHRSRHLSPDQATLRHRP